MEGQELLKAISGMLDEKLMPIKGQLEQLNERMGRVEEESHNLSKYREVIIENIVNAEERDIKIQATIDMELARMSALKKDVMLLKQTVHNHSVKLLMIS